ncbi:MAG: carbohydrate kinase family protein [Clostridia bacterium]|nr:carbohydrate kinase family protein [Clostridia bacterium]
MHIGVIGGLNLDILGFPHQELRLHDSNPGHVTMCAGGVGHNIGVQLTKLGHSVTMLTAIGNDSQALLLANLCRAENIDLSCALKVNAPTCTYLCLHDHTGDMYCALNDMQAVDCLTPDAIKDTLPMLSSCELCVMDANPPAETLLYAAQNLKMPIFADAVSAFKCQKLLPLLPSITAIKPNLMEAEAMTGEKDPEKAAKVLLDSGVQQVFISMGKDGVFYADHFTSGQVPAIALPEGTPLTGAGDCLCAGLIDGLLSRMNTHDIAQLGVRTAYHMLSKQSR